MRGRGPFRCPPLAIPARCGASVTTLTTSTPRCSRFRTACLAQPSWDGMYRQMPRRPEPVASSSSGRMATSGSNRVRPALSAGQTKVSTARSTSSSGRICMGSLAAPSVWSCVILRTACAARPHRRFLRRTPPKRFGYPSPWKKPPKPAQPSICEPTVSNDRQRLCTTTSGNSEEAKSLVTGQTHLDNRALADNSSPGPDEGRYAIAVLLKAFDLLDAIAELNKPTLSQLSDATGQNRPTTLRILSNLVTRGYAERDRDGRYRLGVKLLYLGGRAAASIDLRTIARPALEELHRTLEETINLAIPAEHGIVYIDILESVRDLRMVATVGMRDNFHS